MKLVFATHNMNKFKEVNKILPPHIELLSLTDIGCNEDIAETANTIEGNALLKAQYVRSNYKVDCFADDTGLEVRALDNAPGVYSARYAGTSADSEKNIDKLLENLADILDRQAHFKTVIALATEAGTEMFKGICEGEIIFERRGTEGFGYDAVFRPQGYSKTFAEMTMEEKSEIGHRGKAMRKLMAYLSGRNKRFSK